MSENCGEPRLHLSEELINILSSPDYNIDLSLAALMVSRDLKSKDGIQVDVKKYLRELDSIVEPLKGAVSSSEPEKSIQKLNRSLFIEHGYHTSHAESDEHTLLDEVIDSGRGICIGLSTLYWAVAEKLKLPIKGVLLPDHFIVRWYDNGFVRNIETIDCENPGSESTTLYYLDYFSIHPISTEKGVYLRNMTKPETLAVHFYNFGNEKASLAYGRSLYSKALELNPNYVEAIVNSACIDIGLRKMDSALSKLNRAIELNPNRWEAYSERSYIFKSRGMKELAKADEESFKRIHLDAMGHRKRYGSMLRAYSS